MREKIEPSPNLSKRNFRLAVSDDFSELPNHETAAHFTVHLEAPLLPLASKDALDPDLSLKLHPIGEIIRRSRCVQVALGMSMALAVGNAWFRSESEILLSPILSVFVAFALIGGSVVVWNVKFIAKLSPLAAMEAEKAAIAAILLTYFSVVDTFLGVISGFAVLSWICLVLCFILVIV